MTPLLPRWRVGLTVFENLPPRSIQTTWTRKAGRFNLSGRNNAFCGPSMPDPTTTTAPKPTAPRSALRVVLFGMPDAGKSSLLGALGQAAQTQEHVLNGHLTDLSRGLADMQRRL